METDCLKQYIKELNEQYMTGLAREHAYRPALKELLQSLLPQMVVTNEPAHFECGAPDYIITRQKDHLPVFFVEAKDVGDNDLDGRNKNGHKEQFDRYKQALDYIIFTDYLDFHLYEHGEFVDSIRIAEIKGNKIVGIDEAEDKFLSMVQHLGSSAIQRITSAPRLAKQMAGKARLLANIIETAMNEETHSYENDNLQGQYEAFKLVLIQELKKEDFADIYAQTIAYGMFAARLHDDSLEDFSREEAARLIPKTNPFLRQIFNNLAGNDLDERIAWVVDDLVTVFKATDLKKLMEGYTRDKRHHDPMIHFYEDFLSEYNPKLRKAKGVWYTPQPVVSFIVRAVDEILQKEFGLADGLADYSMIEKEVAVEQSRDKRTTDGMKHRKDKFHRVQILDPATGTGTFLAEVVNQIYDRYRNNQGIWQQYVEQHLLPRLNGFEILMASYAVAHIKLDMLLAETGYEHKSDKRLHVYLTNSLEESNNEPRTLFAQWLSREATEANVIKRDSPVMVMIGNPPYNGTSTNKGDWIMSLMESYKKEPGGKTPLKERNPKWLNDDYVKFIRLAQDYIERNANGVIAFINPHGYLDNPTFRGMRWNLLKTFDKIYTIDLHGNSKKKETCPDGSKDENVFDIMQGVSINLFVKTGKKAKDELGKLYHKDLYGLRQSKYEFLDAATLETVGYKEIQPKAPMYFFVPKDFGLQDEYDKGFKVDELFIQNSMGVTTGHDKELVSFVPFDTQTNAAYYYRPFDKLWIDYDMDKVVRPRETIMKNLRKKNAALCLIKVNSSVDGVFKVLITSGITDKTLLSSKDNTNVFPLYLYTENMGTEERIPNFNLEIVKQIEVGLGKSIMPEELFDYIYAVLHSPSYRERYKEFLKIDFPRIPYPTDIDKFETLVAKGNELRKLHLMENLPSATGVSFPQKGTPQVDCYQWQDNRVYINSKQYFEGVPESAWNFYIGGYQPAQKWLKDRKGRILSFEDVLHYQRIIYVLQQTERVMQEIDKL